MSEPFIGEICCFGFNFAPYGWAQCNGQTMAISQYSALFAILGTTYGGNGTTTFNLPNLQGRIPMHWGNSSSGLNTVIGEPLGTTLVTLTANQLPQHNHPIYAAEFGNASERTANPTNDSYLSTIKGDQVYQSNPTINASFSNRAISPYGASVPHENMQPYLTLNFCISLEGQYPTPP